MKIEFQETPIHWRGAIVVSGKEEFAFEHFTPNSQKRTKNAKGRDVAGISEAKMRALKKTHPKTAKVLGTHDDDMTTFDDFKKRFLVVAQAFILDFAAQHNLPLIPENFLTEIWTTAHIRGLARRLKPGGLTKAALRRINSERLDSFLLNNRSKLKLDEMDRAELAKVVNARLLTPQYSEKAIWQRAYRIMPGFSKRKPGPKPRPIRA